MTLRVAVVDDEAHARAAIRALLGQRNDVAVVAECRNGVEAADVLRCLTVDLLFLDIQMPGMNGFEVIRAVGASRMPPTVFVTAFDTFAIRAFEVEAVDYALKPFDDSRFFAAFDRARGRIQQARMARTARRLLAATGGTTPTSPPATLKRLPVPAGNKLMFLNLDEIEWIEAADQYVSVHAGGKEYLLREPLHRLAKRLPADAFAQIHRSHVVNLRKIREVARLTKGDAEVVLKNGEKLRWSRRYSRNARRNLR